MDWGISTLYRYHQNSDLDIYHSFSCPSAPIVLTVFMRVGGNIKFSEAEIVYSAIVSVKDEE